MQSHILILPAATKFSNKFFVFKQTAPLPKPLRSACYASVCVPNLRYSHSFAGFTKIGLGGKLHYGVEDFLEGPGPCGF